MPTAAKEHVPAIGDRFRLISQTTEFRVTRLYNAAGFIPSVVGVGGGWQTAARVADVIFLDAA